MCAPLLFRHLMFSISDKIEALRERAASDNVAELKRRRERDEKENSTSSDSAPSCEEDAVSNIQ